MMECARNDFQNSLWTQQVHDGSQSYTAYRQRAPGDREETASGFTAHWEEIPQPKLLTMNGLPRSLRNSQKCFSAISM